MVSKVVSLLLLAIVFASIVDQIRCDLVKGVLLGSLIANNQKNDRVIFIPLHGRVKHRQPSKTTTTSAPESTTTEPSTTTTEPTTTTTEPTTTTTEPTTTTAEPTTSTTEPPTSTTTPSPTTSEYDDEDDHHIWIPVMPWMKKHRSG